MGAGTEAPISQGIYIPGTPLTPVLIGKGHILGGWWSKIEVIQVLGIYIYIQISLYMWAGLPSTLYEKEHGWLCFDGCQDLHEAGARGVLGSAHVGFGAQMEFH